jgi:hypothetical protein
MTTTTYKLNGNGVTVTYGTGDTGLELMLDESFSPLGGTHQLAETDLAVTEPGDTGFEVSATVTKEIAGRAGPRTTSLGVRLFLGGEATAEPSAQSDSSGEAVFITAGSPPQFRAEGLSGTVSVAADGGGRGGRGGR